MARTFWELWGHHTYLQRRNRRLQAFFCDEDYEAYIDLMSQWCTHWNIQKAYWEVEKFRYHERTGRPLGTDRFIARLKISMGECLISGNQAQSRLTR